MLNTSSLNTYPLNTEVGSFEGFGVSAAVPHVSEGTAESGPFSNDGNGVHLPFVFLGEAVTPSLFFGASTHVVQTSSGSAVTHTWGAGNVNHYVQTCAGVAYGASSAIGVSLHSIQRSQAAANTGVSMLGDSAHEVMSNAGAMWTANSVNAGVSTHLAQVCRGSALTATTSDEYLDFERDAVIAPTSAAPEFTILQFERS